MPSFVMPPRRLAPFILAILALPSTLLAQDSAVATARPAAAIASPSAASAAGQLLYSTLASELDAAAATRRVRVRCGGEGEAAARVTSRQVSFTTRDGTRQVSVSLVARAAARRGADTSAKGSAATGAVPEFANAEVLVLERGTGVAERVELFTDGTLSVRRSAPGGEPGTARAAEVTSHPAGDPLAAEIRSLANRAWALGCP